MTDVKLLIFCKHFKLGHTKTRLASTVGDVKALEIYKELCASVLLSTNTPQLNRIIYYDQAPAEANSVWQEETLSFSFQSPGDLGHRMHSAFCDECNDNKVVILIGTDCPEITKDHLNQTIDRLTQVDLVIGPTYDGGYYLIAMKKPLKQLFVDMTWSTQNVLRDTLIRCKKHNISYYLLDKLHDIDYEQDWVNYQKRIAGNTKK